jgi:hypothetical protein
MKTFSTVRGVHIPQVAILKEGYDIKLRDENAFTIRANVSAEKIDALFRSSVTRLPEPIFLILESPCNQVREIELRKRPTDPFHRDVYFMEDPDLNKLLKAYEKFQELLIHDGYINFGIKSRKTNDEVFVSAYKIFNFFGQMPNRFEDVLAEFTIPKTEHLITAWNTFTKDMPGQKRRIEINGEDIYGMIEELIRKHGLFHAKTIEG